MHKGKFRIPRFAFGYVSDSGAGTCAVDDVSQTLLALIPAS